MPTFLFSGIEDNGKACSGKLIAESVPDARQRLTAKGVRITRIEVVWSGNSKVPESDSEEHGGRLKRRHGSSIPNTPKVYVTIAIICLAIGCVGFAVKLFVDSLISP